MSYQYEEIRKGKARDIYAVKNGDRCETTAFLDQLKLEDKNTYDQTMGYIRRLADEGPMRNEAVFKKLRDDIYELKCNKLRIFCFYRKGSNRIIVLTHLWKKRPGKEQDRQIDRASRICQNFPHQLEP